MTTRGWPRTIEEAAGSIRTGPALLRDLFWSFHKRAPRLAPVAPLSPAYEINREIIEQIFSTTEWREMRESGTVGDSLSSAMATIGCTSSAVAALNKETIKYLNQLHELTGEVEQLFARAEALDELAALSPDEERSEQLKREASEARAGAAKKEKKAERLYCKLEESTEEREQNVRRAVRRGLAEAMADFEQASEAIKAFGGGYETAFGTENGGGGRSLSTKEKLVIAQQEAQSGLAKIFNISAVAAVLDYLERPLTHRAAFLFSIAAISAHPSNISFATHASVKPPIALTTWLRYRENQAENDSDACCY
jgi:hypothetical protein